MDSKIFNCIFNSIFKYIKPMKKFVFIICSILFLNISLAAQKNKLIVVKAGRNVGDYFPVEERYRFPEFSAGKAVFRSGVFSEARFNYNLLQNEMEFIQTRDTLTIVNKKDVRYIVVSADTFYYDNGYIEIISGGPLKVGMKKYYKLNDVQKTDSYGIASSGSSRESYSGLSTNGNFYKLKATSDMIFQKNIEYYLSPKPGEFIPFRKNSVIKLFPAKESEIKSYLKTNKVDFDSQDDLLKFAGYLNSL